MVKVVDVLRKAVVGGLVTALIVIASRRGNVLPGILPLVPTFTIIALLAVGAQNGIDAFRATCLAGAKTVPAYLAFVAACYLLVGRVDYRIAILGGLAAWGVAVFLMFSASRLP